MKRSLLLGIGLALGVSNIAFADNYNACNDLLVHVDENSPLIISENGVVTNTDNDTTIITDSYHPNAQKWVHLRGNPGMGHVGTGPTASVKIQMGNNPNEYVVLNVHENYCAWEAGDISYSIVEVGPVNSDVMKNICVTTTTGSYANGLPGMLYVKHVGPC